MDLGVAGTIAVKHVTGGDIGKSINYWLEKNPDTEVIDIKFSASANDSDWTTDALIIYRKDV